MLRTPLVALCRFLLRIFFRRIEVVGRHHLPEDGAVLFALNHPSGLIDPLFILCLSKRRVSFLAKEPLFRMPIVGFFVRAFESLPVYRSQDGADPQKNRKMMRAATALLARGNALAVFPEGVSHSDTNLKRFRSGAARIALSARALGDGPVRIVPAALYYEGKQTFRSRAVLALGAPMEVPEVALDESGNSPHEVGKGLTSELRAAIESIMPTADTAEALVLAERAERVLSAAVRDAPEACKEATATLLPEGTNSEKLTLADRMARRRHLLDKYFELADIAPTQVGTLIQAIARLGDDLEAAGLPIDAAPGSAHLSRRRWTLLLLGILLAPLALVGALVHAPAYQTVRIIAFRYSGDQTDVTATVKLLAGLLFFPLTWALGAWFIGKSGGPWRHWGVLLALACGPLLGWVTVVTTEIWGSIVRTWGTSRRARRANLDWGAIVERRTQVVQEMARLTSLAKSG